MAHHRKTGRYRRPVLMTPDRRAGTALVLGGLLAGGNAVGIRFTNRELEPLWGAGLRFAIAAALLGCIVVLRHLGWPSGHALLGAALFGLLNFAGAFGFGYYALVSMQAGVASTLLALVPLVTLAFAVAHRQEQLTRAGVVGGVTALVGVAVLSGASLAGEVPLLSVLAAVGSVCCFAEAAVLIRRLPRLHPVVMNAVAMAVGAVVLLLASALFGESWVLPSSSSTWLALAYLVVFGSIVVFLLFLLVLRHWQASRAAYLDVLIPPSAVLLSSWLDDEPITAGLVAGGVLVLIGAYVGAMRPAPATSA